MRMNCGTICCDLEIAKEFTCGIDSNVRCEYPEDTIEYALKHFFRKDEKTRKSCIYESWQIRLAKGRRNRKPHYYSYYIPARMLELPGSWAVMKFSVDEKGVSILSLKLSMNFPANRWTDSKYTCRLCA